MGRHPFSAADVDDDPEAVFAALREAVFDDVHLLNELRPPAEREAFVARVVGVAGARGMSLAADTVQTVMRAGEERWLATGGET